MGLLLYKSRCLSLVLCGLCLFLRGDYEERSLVFVAVATITAHCFPACFSLRQLHHGDLLWANSSKVSTFVPGLNLSTLPASVLVLLLALHPYPRPAAALSVDVLDSEVAVSLHKILVSTLYMMVMKLLQTTRKWVMIFLQYCSRV
jgi:hypothetical protein